MSGDDKHPGMPRWAKALLGLLIVIVLLVLLVILLGDGDHGPGRHAPSEPEMDETNSEDRLDPPFVDRLGRPQIGHDVASWSSEPVLLRVGGGVPSS